jgi:hypothetical protein
MDTEGSSGESTKARAPASQAPYSEWREPVKCEMKGYDGAFKMARG